MAPISPFSLQDPPNWTDSVTRVLLRRIMPESARSPDIAADALNLRPPPPSHATTTPTRPPPSPRLPAVWPSHHRISNPTIFRRASAPPPGSKPRRRPEEALSPTPAPRTMAPGATSRAGKARRSTRRSDRDGDVKMGAEPLRRSRGIEKSSTKNNTTTPARKSGARGGRADLTNGRIQQRLAKATASGDVHMKEGPTPKKGGLVEFKITGWYRSAASDAADHGSSSLQHWLEGKLRRKLEATPKQGQKKIRKSRVDGETLYVSVVESDARYVERMNGFQWAKATLHIQRVGGAVQQGLSSKAEETKAMLQDVLDRRYNAELKLLDLSALAQDPELQAQAIFDNSSTASKFFPAMMVVLEYAFEKPEDRNAMFDSVSLANNQLTDLKAVTSLSTTLPKIKNLDLSGNKFEKLADLANWKRRFINLQHLVTTGNPLEQNEPNFAAELLQWYPNLMLINGAQVRTEEEIKAKTDPSNIPFPIRGSRFMDEGGIAETFVRNLVAGLDADRPGLAQFYYDDDSTFSFAVNTSAPRDPAGAGTSGPGAWDAYLKNSLNLKKVHHMPARTARESHGAEQVATVLASLPKTKHPDLATEGNKWLIEANIQPGLPDPTGANPHGVDGLSISLHGEFDELDENNNPTAMKRSVDHFIQIGPALPAKSEAVVRVVSHMMTVRSYGGAQAFAECYGGGN